MKIVFVEGDDWEGVYGDGKLLAEGHRLNKRDVLDALGIEYEELNADKQWLEDSGRLPTWIEDVVSR